MALRILLVSDHYPPFIGGAHRQTQLLAQELYQRGHKVSVATVWHPGLPEQEDDAGVTVYRLKQLRTVLSGSSSDRRQRHQPPFPDPITVRRLRGLIGELKPDLVHSYGWFSYSCALALLGKSTPLLISARDYAYGCATRTLVYRGREICDGPSPLKCLGCAAQHYGKPKGWAATLGVYLGRALLRRKVRAVHSISAYVEEMVQRDFLPPGARLPQVIIPSFREDTSDLTTTEDASLQPYIRRLPDEPYILFVGALRKVKGLTQLLAAYERLSAAPPLVLIGTLESDTPKTFPPGVVVLQNFPHAAVMEAWERCLFGVVPSLWPEPLGSVVYEGMSKGKAVIGTRPGGHTDMIVDGESGLLVPTGDVDALTSAMRSLVADGSLRERLGRAAKERARLFTAATSVPQFIKMYRELVPESTGRVHEGNSLSLG